MVENVPQTTQEKVKQLIEEAKQRANGKIIGMISRVYPVEYGEENREVKIEVSFDTYLNSNILIGSYLGISLPVSKTLMLSRVKEVTRQDILSMTRTPSLIPQENLGGINTPLIITVELLSEKVNGEVVPPSSPIDPQSPVFLPSLDFIREMLGIPQDGITIGKVVEGYRLIDVEVKLSKEALRHHVLVSGTTGAGKTNLLKLIIKRSDIPLIVFDMQGDYVKTIAKLGGAVILPITRKYSMDPVRLAQEFLRTSGLEGYKIIKVEEQDGGTGKRVKVIIGNGESTFTLYLLGFRIYDNYKLIPDVFPYFSPQGREVFKSVSDHCVNKKDVIDNWEENCSAFMKHWEVHWSTEENVLRSVALLRDTGVFDVSYGKDVYYTEPDYSEIMKTKAVVDLRWALENGVNSAMISSFIILSKIFQIIDERYKKERKETDYLIIFDEAHEYFPQNRGNLNKEALEGLINKIMRLGRVRGIGVVLATHRPTDLNDLVLTLTNTKIALRSDEDALKKIRMDKYSKVLNVSPPGYGVISSYTIKASELIFRAEKYEE